MQHFDTMYLKTIFFAFPLMVIGSSKAWADLFLPIVTGDDVWVTETREFMLSSDSIMFIGFVFWIAYTVFCFPKHTLRKL